MKAFVTGAGGQLGHDVVNQLKRKRFEVVGSDIQTAYNGIKDSSEAVGTPYVQLGITDKESVLNIISEIQPDVIIHCAAWTAVDAAEEEENKAKVDA